MNVSTPIACMRTVTDNRQPSTTNSQPPNNSDIRGRKSLHLGKNEDTRYHGSRDPKYDSATLRARQISDRMGEEKENNRKKIGPKILPVDDSPSFQGVMSLPRLQLYRLHRPHNTLCCTILSSFFTRVLQKNPSGVTGMLDANSCNAEGTHVQLVVDVSHPRGGFPTRLTYGRATSQSLEHYAISAYRPQVNKYHGFSEVLKSCKYVENQGVYKQKVPWVYGTPIYTCTT